MKILYYITTIMQQFLKNILKKRKEPKFPLLFQRYCKDIKDVLNDNPALYDEEGFLDEFNERFSKISDFFRSYVTKKWEEQSFYLLIKFLRNLQGMLWVRLVYNYTPSISYEDYAKKELWEQLLNNVFNNQIYIYKDCLIKKNFIKWGSCHHRSIFIKKFCNNLGIHKLKTTIIQKPWGHSFIRLAYWNSMYLSDITQWKDIMDYAKIMRSWDSNHFATLDIENSDLFEIDTIEHFLHHLKNKTYNEINIEINRLKLHIDKYNLFFKINSKQTAYENIWYTKVPIDINTQEEIFKILLPHRKYLIPYLAQKINLNILKSLVCE